MRHLLLLSLSLLTTGLAGQSAMLAHWSFDDPAGTGVYETVQGITEVVSGTDARVPGPFGTALACDGFSTYIGSAVNQSTWNYLSSFTVTCWVRLSPWQTNWVPIIDQHDWSFLMGLFCGFSSANEGHVAVGNGGSWQSLYGPTLVANAWTHTAFVFDAAAINEELKCYVDGVLVLTTNIPGGPMLDPRGIVQPRIGARAVGGGGFLSGDLDDLAIFDGPLDQVAIQAVMNNGAGLGFLQYQTNSALMGLDVNGSQGFPWTPATVTLPAGAAATLNMSSSNLGFLWDLGYGPAPLLPASGGGLATAGGQVLNLDLGDPLFGTLWNYSLSPYGFVNVAIPFSVPNSGAVSLQMLILAPSLPDGVALSQPTRLIVQ